MRGCHLRHMQLGKHGGHEEDSQEGVRKSETGEDVNNCVKVLGALKKIMKRIPLQPGNGRLWVRPNQFEDGLWLLRVSFRCNEEDTLHVAAHVGPDEDWDLGDATTR